MHIPPPPPPPPPPQKKKDRQPRWMQIMLGWDVNTTQENSMSWSLIRYSQIRLKGRNILQAFCNCRCVNIIYLQCIVHFIMSDSDQYPTVVYSGSMWELDIHDWMGKKAANVDTCGTYKQYVCGLPFTVTLINSSRLHQTLCWNRN